MIIGGLGRRAAWKYPEGIQVIAEYEPSAPTTPRAAAPGTQAERRLEPSAKARIATS
jgi:hypothetical protein